MFKPNCLKGSFVLVLAILGWYEKMTVFLISLFTVHHRDQWISMQNCSRSYFSLLLNVDAPEHEPGSLKKK